MTKKIFNLRSKVNVVKTKKKVDINNFRSMRAFKKQ